LISTTSILKRASISDAVDAAKSNSLTINILVRIKQVKMDFIVFVNAVEIQRTKSLNIRLVDLLK
jgi:hypothetical protein